ncbi:SDR family NAD(P)-dependent oxidoreductase [bacterium]|nr:SDR family NAD(P)-dependent oxidoreductase [candidate division CSSED10-310 bacterium]
MKLYLITGTTRGLGKALADNLATDRNVHVTSINRIAPEPHPGIFRSLIADLARPEDIPNLLETFFESINLENYDKIVLINNAGVLEPIKPLGRCDSGELINAIRIDLIAPAVLINEFLKWTDSFSGLREIINITSGAAQHPYYGWTAYCTSKAGLDMLARVCAEENRLIRTNTRIWNVAPGVLNTGMQRRIRETSPEDFIHVNQFIAYFETNQLVDPEISARDILKMEAENLSEDGGIYDIRSFRS